MSKLPTTWIGGAIAALFALLPPAAGAQAPPDIVQVCSACHAQSDPQLSAPKLEGQSTAYLARQIRAFVRGERTASIEGGTCATEEVLRTLVPLDFIQLSTFYSRQAMGSEPPSAAPFQVLQRGGVVYAQGSIEAGVQPCARCHGEDGEGGPASTLLAPPLAGQRPEYLRDQLLSFRTNHRTSADGTLMRGATLGLPDSDIEAVAEYLAALESVTVEPAGSADREEAVERPEKAALCEQCHGDQGESLVDGFPRIAGLSAEYLVKQLMDIKEGRRNIDVMVPVVLALTDEDIAALSQYFASFSMRQGPYDPARARRGEELYLAGGEHFPACMYCHGADALGMTNVEWSPGGIPRLAGQLRGYLVKTLTDFKKDRRVNDRGSMMRLVAIEMTDSQIEDVAHYLYSIGDLVPGSLTAGRDAEEP